LNEGHITLEEIMATVNINVAVTPKGKSIADGVAFAYAPGVNTPTGVVSTDGKIDLSKQFPQGASVTLAFALTTGSLTFSGGPNVGTFPLSFFGGANGPKDAFWLAPEGQAPRIYNGSQFTFPPNSLGPGYSTLTVVDANSDGALYQYALWVFTATSGSLGQTFEDDPKLINHPNNK
jgi:hypothetical protein